jgi:cytosine/creatinine deaminase
MLLRSATTSGGEPVDVRIEGATIAAVAPAGSLTPIEGEDTHDLRGWVLLPAPCEPHAHLDKAFLADLVPNPKGDLLTAIRSMDSYRDQMTPEEVAGRAERAIRIMAANGTTTIRTHADTVLENGTRSIEGLVLARSRTADVADVQIVALLGRGVSDPATASSLRSLMHDALDAGADLIGGCPHLEVDPELGLETLLTVAGERGVPIDLHTDETLNPAMLNLRSFARRVLDTGYGHGATASHCVSLGQQDVATQQEVAELCAASGVAVVTLPQTNLFLQGRDHPSCTPRGLTAVRALLDAGATLAGGADNLQDPFNTVGKGDALETAALLVMAGHLSPDEAYHAVSAASRTTLGLPAVTLAVGSPAELLAVKAASLREAIAFQPWERIVIRKGRIATSRG